MKKQKFDVYQQVTDSIIASLEAGTAAWVKPWSTDRRSMPVTLPSNLVTGDQYRGVNIFMLWSAAVENGWDDWRFCTYKQAQSIGANVIAKQKSVCRVIKPLWVDDKDKPRDDGSFEQKFVCQKSYALFNISQLENLPAEFEPTEPVPLPENAISDFLQALGSTVKHGGSEACYIPALDLIKMPLVSDFKSIDHYHNTRFHEEGHRTGHKDRCNRDLKGYGQDRKAYAFEELVAELSAAILCAEFQIEGTLQHADYIATWLKMLRDDKRAFMRAASASQKAVDWMRDRAIEHVSQAA